MKMAEVFDSRKDDDEIVVDPYEGQDPIFRRFRKHSGGFILPGIGAALGGVLASNQQLMANDAKYAEVVVLSDTELANNQFAGRFGHPGEFVAVLGGGGFSQDEEDGSDGDDFEVLAGSDPIVQMKAFLKTTQDKAQFDSIRLKMYKDKGLERVELSKQLIKQIYVDLEGVSAEMKFALACSVVGEFSIFTNDPRVVAFLKIEANMKKFMEYYGTYSRLFSSMRLLASQQRLREKEAELEKIKTENALLDLLLTGD